MAVTTYGGVSDPRQYDPARGSFEPRVLEPPNGVHHQDKSRQDRMPAAKRPRVLEAQARREAMA